MLEIRRLELLPVRLKIKYLLISPYSWTGLHCTNPNNHHGVCTTLPIIIDNCDAL
jgi:hypothetical protein